MLRTSLRSHTEQIPRRIRQFLSSNAQDFIEESMDEALKNAQTGDS